MISLQLYFLPDLFAVSSFTQLSTLELLLLLLLTAESVSKCEQCVSTAQVQSVHCLNRVLLYVESCFSLGHDLLELVIVNDSLAAGKRADQLLE